jgi:hypothetical protein
LQNDDLLAESQVFGGKGSAVTEHRAQEDNDHAHDAHRQVSVWVM